MITGPKPSARLFCKVLKSELFHYDSSGRNITLDNLQEHLAKSLQKANQPGNPDTGGWSIHLILGKGDWKWKREWLCQGRHYGASGHICPRCFASAADDAEKPWLDSLERFNNQTDIQAARESRVGHNIWHLGYMRPSNTLTLHFLLNADSLGSSTRLGVLHISTYVFLCWCPNPLFKT